MGIFQSKRYEFDEELLDQLSRDGQRRLEEMKRKPIRKMYEKQYLEQRQKLIEDLAKRTYGTSTRALSSRKSPTRYSGMGMSQLFPTPQYASARQRKSPKSSAASAQYSGISQLFPTPAERWNVKQRIRQFERR